VAAHLTVVSVSTCVCLVLMQGRHVVVHRLRSCRVAVKFVGLC
jgi:hypothetical protein